MSVGVEALLDASDILVLPSFGENLPISVLEALAHAAAVICTRVAAPPDIIERESTGLIVKPGDVEGLASALGRPIDDQYLRRRPGKDGDGFSSNAVRHEVCAERLVCDLD
jgi:glycosyltransferase involved in cell wall biosynthesis